MNDLYGLVLIGGKSQRMQADKAKLQYHEKEQYLVCYELLKKYCSRVFLSLRETQALEIANHIPHIYDKNKYENTGPLAGILSAMDAFSYVGWIILACDLPRVNDSLMEILLAKRNTPKMATAFKSKEGGLPEPLCAIYETTFYQNLQSSFEKKIYCPRQIMMCADIELIDLPFADALENINHREEYQAMNI